MQSRTGNLGWVNNPSLNHVFELTVSSVVTNARLFALQLVNNNGTLNTGIFSDLTNWFFKCTKNNADTSFFITISL